VDTYVLVADCPERIGIVRAISEFIYSLGATILDASQFTDLENQRFFARWVFAPVDDQALPDVGALREQFSPIADGLSMKWEISDGNVKPRILVAVSKFGHCLNDMLNRWHEDELPGEIVGVVSNHEKFRDKVEWYGLPFFYLPVDPDNRWGQEKEILDIMGREQIDLLVLARYMQILSDKMCERIEGRAINIHHSFLPGFKGAKPYHQAFDRGVKVIGATAHYVTKDLDEGPIIEQDVQRVEHYYDGEALARLGQNVETVVLAKAVWWHCQHRVIINDKKTVVFK